MGMLLATLVVRALLPVGYMPGDLLAGELAQLCPVASAATFELLDSNSAHEHSHSDNGNEYPSVGTACPIGSSLFFDALPSLNESNNFAVLRHPRPHTLTVRSHLSSFTPTYPARAPPHS